MKEMIRVTELTVDYDKTPALWEISFTLSTPSLIAVIGPNGAGKSTLLKAMLGLVKPTRGKVEMQEGLKIGYVPQCQSVDWDFPLTVYDLVMMGRFGHLRYFLPPSRKDLEIVEECLARVGLLPLRKRQISQLSGGQRARAFLARALAMQADLYFLDEPFAAIDEASAQVIMEILLELEKEKILFVVHHDLQLVKEKFSQALLLSRRLVAIGSTKEVLTESHLRHAYGRENLLFDEALKVTEQKSMGLVL